MVVGSGDSIGVVVEQARHERADHEVISLEGLVNGRRLVQAAGDRLEVVDTEGPWIEVAIPTDDIEGVVVEEMAGDAVAHLDAHFELAALGEGLQLFWGTEIAFAVRGMLEQLTIAVAVAVRGLDLRNFR
jgi:hypothetical protein